MSLSTWYTEYKKRYYHEVLAPKQRLKRWGDKKCTQCGILLSSKYGSKYSRKTCQSETCRRAQALESHNIRSRRYKAKLREQRMRGQSGQNTIAIA